MEGWLFKLLSHYESIFLYWRRRFSLFHTFFSSSSSLRRNAVLVIDLYKNTSWGKLGLQFISMCQPVLKDEKEVCCKTQNWFSCTHTFMTFKKRLIIEKGVCSSYTKIWLQINYCCCFFCMTCFLWQHLKDNTQVKK